MTPVRSSTARRICAMRSRPWCVRAAASTSSSPTRARRITSWSGCPSCTSTDGNAFEPTLDALRPGLDDGEHDVEADQGCTQDRGADERRVVAHERLAHEVADHQQDDEVERRELAERAPAGEPQQHDQEGVARPLPAGWDPRGFLTAGRDGGASRRGVRRCGCSPVCQPEASGTSASSTRVRPASTSSMKRRSLGPAPSASGAGTSSRTRNASR